MNICPTCRREMVCKKTGVTVHFGGGHCYAGDRFACPACGGETVRCGTIPYFDPEYRKHVGDREIIEMTEGLAKMVENLAMSITRAIAKQLK